MHQYKGKCGSVGHVTTRSKQAAKLVKYFKALKCSKIAVSSTKTTKRFSNFDTSIYHVQGRWILEAKTLTPNNISSAMGSVRSVSHCISTGIRHLLQFFLQATLVGTVRNINFYSLYINQHVKNRHTENSTNHQKCCAFSIFSSSFFFFLFFTFLSN